MGIERDAQKVIDRGQEVGRCHQSLSHASAEFLGGIFDQDAVADLRM